MKIINAMFAKGLGGIEQAFLDYSKAICLAGHQLVAVIHPKAAIESNIVSLQKEFPDQIEIKKIPNIGWWDISAILCLECVIRKSSADLVITHGNRPTSLMRFGARKNKVKLFAVAHNYKIKPLLKADHIFSITEDLKSFIGDKGFGEDNIFVIPNMITISEEEKNNKFKEYSPSPVIGVMARFVKKKGVDVFLNACSALKSQGVEFQAVIGGTGDEANNLQALRDELKLNDQVKFTGWVKDKDAFYNSIDIFCLPSHHEPFGIVILEAMLKNKPIVSTDSEGPVEILEDGKDGILVEKGHAGQMAMALQEMIENQEKAKSMANSANEKLKSNYAIENVSRKLDAAIKQVVN